jgi:pimeloyl-ACP methyl ester carboxylesterase
MWRDFPARVASATGCSALVFSRAGYAGSDPVALPRPLTYMHHEGEQVLPLVLDAARVRQAVLVGHSDGASIALVFAGAHPQDARLRGLILEAPHVFCEELSVRSIAAARDAFDRGDLRSRLARWHGANVDVAFRGWNDAWLDPQFCDWNLERYVPHVRVPMLLVQGADDEYGTLAQLDAIERGARAPVERVVLDECGHSPHRDRAAATQDAMVQFVRRVIDRRG